MAAQGKTIFFASEGKWEDWWICYRLHCPVCNPVNIFSLTGIFQENANTGEVINVKTLNFLKPLKYSQIPKKFLSSDAGQITSTLVSQGQSQKPGNNKILSFLTVFPMMMVIWVNTRLKGCQWWHHFSSEAEKGITCDSELGYKINLTKPMKN